MPGLALFPFLIIAALLGFIFLAFGFTGRTAGQTAPAETHAERWQQDVDALTQQILEKHVNPFWIVSEGDFMAQAQELKAQAANLSDEEMLFGVMKLMGSVGDGHTYVTPEGIFEEAANKRFPVEITWFDNGLFVTRAAPETQEALGAQLIAVEGISIEEILARVEPALTYDDGNPYGRRTEFEWFVARPLLLYAAGLIPDEAAGEFTFSRDGESFTLTLGGRDRDSFNLVGPDLSEVPLYWQGVLDDVTARTTYLENEGAVYLQYNSSTEIGFNFTDASVRALRFARREGAKKLIVDVRRNTGGSNLASELFSYRLGQHPFLQNGGKLYVIMGQDTFSSGFDVVSQLVRPYGAVTVGQPAGTRPNFFGNVGSFTLPNSGITVGVPNTLSPNFPELGDVRVYPPDLEVAFTSHDFFAGRDPYVEAALAN